MVDGNKSARILKRFLNPWEKKSVWRGKVVSSIISFIFWLLFAYASSIFIYFLGWGFQYVFLSTIFDPWTGCLIGYEQNSIRLDMCFRGEKEYASKSVFNQNPNFSEFIQGFCITSIGCIFSWFIYLIIEAFFKLMKLVYLEAEQRLADLAIEELK